MQATSQLFFVSFTLTMEARNYCETLVMMLLLVAPCASVEAAVPKDRISFIFRFEDSRP
jgi:hypothetical protein